jgi:ribonucleoside-diphosphate reductase alpha chain
MGLWEDVKERIIEEQGNIENIEGLPQHLKEIYKTAFTTNAYAYIEVVARAQKWVDQALSRNIYLEDRDMDNMKNVYMAAWRKGLKTTYYLHMKPRHTAEQSTTSVNKQEMTGKRGFGAIKTAAAAAPAIEAGTPSPVEVNASPVKVTEVPVFAQVQQKPVVAEMKAAVAEMEPAVEIKTPNMQASVGTAAKPAGFSAKGGSASGGKKSQNIDDMPDDGADSPNVCIACQ